MVKLRDYQEDAVSKTILCIEENKEVYFGGLVALPTGTGKSYVISETIHRILKFDPNARIMMITHSKELVKQNYKAVVKIHPYLRKMIGRYCAGLNLKQLDKQITFGSIQSLYNKNEVKADYVLVDEVHKVSASNKSMYTTFFEKIKAGNDKFKLIGYTATAYRSDTGCMTNHKLFNEIIINLCDAESISKLIKMGYLCPLTTGRATINFNLTNVKKYNHDYKADELDRAVNQDVKNRKIIDETIILGKDRKCWLIFTVSINHAENLVKILIEKGIKAGCVHSRKGKSNNDFIIEKFKKGEIQCLVNKDMLTTGFDNPNIDLIVMLRPTQSVSLHIQMLGRGTRVSKNKKDCLVLDYGDNIGRLGAFDDPIEVNPERKVTHVKCPACLTRQLSTNKECRECGLDFSELKQNDNDQKACPNCQINQHFLNSECINKECSYIFSRISELKNRKVLKGSKGSKGLEWYSISNFKLKLTSWTCLRLDISMRDSDGEDEQLHPTITFKYYNRKVNNPYKDLFYLLFTKYYDFNNATIAKLKQYNGFDYSIRVSDRIHILIDKNRLENIRKQKKALYRKSKRYYPATHDKKLVKGYCVKGNYYARDGRPSKEIEAI